MAACPIIERQTAIVGFRALSIRAAIRQHFNNFRTGGQIGHALVDPGTIDLRL
jgi:hypothetical protein